jgi:dGTPase
MVTTVSTHATLVRSRTQLEEREAQALSPLAALSRDAERHVGSDVDPPPVTRTHFQRDWNRVMHSEAFRKLEYKTQVFPFGEGLDVTRTRLTHTLEVSQIAQAICVALGLNDDLARAIALAHDLGHPPFGHSGEDVLAEFAGFNHNAHGLKIVTELEHRYPFSGLNLTTVVLEGMEKHDVEFDRINQYELFRGQSPSLESQVASVADVIAYRSHDLEDALNSGLLNKDQFRQAGLDLWEELEAHVEQYPENIRTAQTTRTLINLFISDMLAESERRLTAFGATTLQDVRKADHALISFSETFDRRQRELGTFLRGAFYQHYKIMRMTDKGKRVIRALIDEYQRNTNLLPQQVQDRLHTAADGKSVIADYIAGMTDRYAVREYARLFDPEVRV